MNETINISADGSRATFTRDGADITMDVHGTETIEFHALGGADTITSTTCVLSLRAAPLLRRRRRNTIVEGNVNGNLGADFQIELHNFTGQLHASDFLH